MAAIRIAAFQNRQLRDPGSSPDRIIDQQELAS
jgi:hypothetical protein